MHIYTWCYFYCFRMLMYDSMIIEPCNTIQMSRSFQQFITIGVCPVYFQRMWPRQLWACSMLWLMSWYQLITLFTYFSYFAWVAIVLYANSWKYPLNFKLFQSQLPMIWYNQLAHTSSTTFTCFALTYVCPYWSFPSSYFLLVSLWMMDCVCLHLFVCFLKQWCPFLCIGPHKCRCVNQLH